MVWPDIQDAATVLHKYHPDAKVWVSAQEFNASDLTDFFKTIDTPSVRICLYSINNNNNNIYIYIYIYTYICIPNKKSSAADLL